MLSLYSNNFVNVSVSVCVTVLQDITCTKQNFVQVSKATWVQQRFQVLLIHVLWLICLNPAACFETCQN